MGSFLKDIQKAMKTAKKAKKTVDKSTTPKTDKAKASSVDDDGFIAVSIVGTKYLEDDVPIKEAQDGDPVTLKQNPENEYDKNAIQVLDSKGRMLGYMPRGKEQQKLNKLINDGYKIEAEIQVEDEDDKEISVYIEYYK